MTRRTSPFTTALDAAGMLVADGAMGTALFEGGLEAGGSPELLNVTNPDLVASVHRSYTDAGADIILTNTFGGNRYRMELHGLTDRVQELNAAAARVARSVAESADRDVVVAGSIGPTGSLLTPYGLLTEPDAEAAFAEQVAGLVDGGVDVLWIETMSAIEELAAAYRACSATDLPIVATMSFDSHGHTMMGVHPTRLGEWAGGTELSGVGANCGIGPDDVIAAAAAIAESQATAAVVAKGNCGVPLFSGMTLEYPTTAADMGDYVEGAIAAGATIVGACCGSTPEHIAAIRQRVDEALSLEKVR